jgi:hypothetical protein
MKKAQFLLLIIFTILAKNSYSQEFKVLNFKHIENNTTARIYKKNDVNGQSCGVLIIKHNFSDFIIETGKGYEGKENKIGETWLWLSPDEYQLIIRKEGYVPLYYNLKDKIQSLETFELTVTNDYGVVEINIPKADILLDGQKVGESNCVLNLKEGSYIVKAIRQNYYPDERKIIINAGDSLDIEFDLKAKMGNLTITTKDNSANGASVYIDNNLQEEQLPLTISLITGDYTMRIEKEGFLNHTQNIKIEENKSTIIEPQLIENPMNVVTKHKRRKSFWLGTGIAFTGVGIFSVVHSNQLYKDYQTAGSDAADIRKKIETYDIIYPVAFGLAAFCGVEFVIQSKKYNRALNSISFYPVIYENGGVVCIQFYF